MPDVSRRKVAGDQDYACGDDRVMSASKSNAQPNFDPRTQHNMKNVFQTHTAKGSRGHNTSICILAAGYAWWQLLSQFLADTSPDVTKHTMLQSHIQKQPWPCNC